MSVLLIDIRGKMNQSGVFPYLTVGDTYYGRVTADGGTPFYTYVIIDGILPAGLSLDNITGEVTGTPTDKLMAAITVRATDLQGMYVDAAYVIPGAKVQRLLLSKNVDIVGTDASEDGSVASLVIDRSVVAIDKDSRIIVSKPKGLKYQAWSRWLTNEEAHAEGVPGWANIFAIACGSTPTITKYWDDISLMSDDINSAEDKVSGLKVIVSGFLEYKIFPIDDDAYNNRGGFSAHVEVWG